MKENLYQNRKHHIYLPKDSKNPVTLGEKWFFEGKFWKLQVMMGNWWNDLNNTKRGFSLFSRFAEKRVNYLLDRLDTLGIEYKTDISEAGWQYRVNISAKKRNLELIDKLYEEYYNTVIKEHSGWFRYKNEIMDSDVRYNDEIYFSKYPDTDFEIVK